MTVTYPVTGIDVSYANAGDLSNPRSIDFIFVKASEGNAKDPRYDQHSGWAKRHNILLGAYDFGRRSAGTGGDQARAFLSVIGSDTKLVALDMEGADEPTVAQAADWIATCRAAGKTAGIYHSLSGFPRVPGSQFSWVALYNGRTHAPTIGWEFWQWAGSPLDRDYYSGTLASLAALAQVAPPITGGPIVPGGDMAIAQGGLNAYASGYRLNLKAGQALYNQAGGTSIRTRMAHAGHVAYVGLTNGWYAVQVRTAAYADHVARLTVLYVPTTVGKPYKA